MRQDIKTAWTKALRSGDYQQTQGRLCDANGYCCIGVLTEVLAKDFPAELDGYTVDLDYQQSDGKRILITGPGYDNIAKESFPWSSTTSLPNQVWDRLESKSDQGLYMSMNDTEGLNFETIAERIDQNE